MSLLIDTRVHGATLHDVSRKTGVKYETLKKRRLRVEARLRELIAPKK
jgi:lambda repressor-like predicted transcriptional regulator